SLYTYSWNQRAASGAAAATVSSGCVANVDTTITVPAAAVPRAVPPSPSALASSWYAVGATSTGAATGVPSTVVMVSTTVTSRSTGGRTRSRSHAATLSRTVDSSSAPPRK